MRKELERLKNQTAVPGRATIGMMQEFKEFPWTQDVIITMGRREEVLMSFLEVYLELDGDTLKYWKSEFELWWRAMLSLAVYEAYTPKAERVDVYPFVNTYQENTEGMNISAEADPLGNSLVVSARELGGGEKKLRKSRKPRKPHSLGRGRKKTKATGRGRGGKRGGRGGRGRKKVSKAKAAKSKKQENGTEDEGGK